MKQTNIKQKIQKIRSNHGLMMIICCGLLLLLLSGAVYFLGLSKSYLFWFVLLLCPLMHYFMMEDAMHNHNAEEKGKKRCH